MNVFSRLALIGAGAVTICGLVGVGYVHIASEHLISRVYQLPDSHVRAATGADAVARGTRLVFAYGCATATAANCRAYLSHISESCRATCRCWREASQMPISIIL